MLVSQMISCNSVVDVLKKNERDRIQKWVELSMKIHKINRLYITITKT